MKNQQNIYKKNNITTYPFTKIIGLENISFGINIIIDDFVFISARDKIIIGNNVHIACFTSIAGGGSVSIGDFASISHGCRVFSATDDFKDWGFGNPTIPLKHRNVKKAEVKIGKFCIIGANSVILPGVSIGEGSSVGANSVVTKDLEPWGVYIGNKRIKNRNRKEIIKNYKKFLKNSKII